MIEKKLQHPYVEKFVKKPFVDEDKLEILDYIYQQVQIPTTIKQQHIITIMLVQIALDTHEQIPNQNKESTMQETEKQLSVLAGDYYSGLYYLLLAEIEEVKLVQVLASAIRIINEHKVSLFYDDVRSIHELFDIICQIESTLFTEVANYLCVDKQIIEVIQEVLLLHRLQEEQAGDGMMSHYIRKQNHHINFKNDSMFPLNEMYHLHKKQLESLLMQLPYQHMQLADSIRQKFTLSYNRTVAEEG